MLDQTPKLNRLEEDLQRHSNLKTSIEELIAKNAELLPEGSVHHKQFVDLLKDTNRSIEQIQRTLKTFVRLYERCPFIAANSAQCMLVKHGEGIEHIYEGKGEIYRPIAVQRDGADTMTACVRNGEMCTTHNARFSAAAPHCVGWKAA